MLQENAVERASYDAYLNKLYNDNSALMSRFRHMFFLAMRQELTEKQYQAISYCCLEGHSQYDLARKWGVNQSVISRHITRGKRRLRRLLKYNLEFQDDFL